MAFQKAIAEAKANLQNKTTEWWTTDKSACVDPMKRATGDGGVGDVAPTTICRKFKECVKNHGTKLALVSCDNKHQWTWTDYYNDCRTFAKALMAVGFQKHDIINIIGFNSPEWVIADVGAIFAGGIAAGVYTTNGAESCLYQAVHSQAKVIVVEGQKQLKKYLEIIDHLPFCKAIVVYNDEIDSDTKAKVPIYNFKDFMALGKGSDDKKLDECMDGQKPGECCTLIYTSGTTGRPKAVMISHDNICFTSMSMAGLIDGLSCNERLISYLPLSHIAAQMLDIYMGIMFGSKLYFADPMALKGTLLKTLLKVKPTIFFGVPRVWQKIEEKMRAAGKETREAGGIKYQLVSWAKGKGFEYYKAQQFGESGVPPCCFSCANSLVLMKIREKLGLTECRVALTGAAPIAFTTLELFAGLNIPVFELFGQSECTGPACSNYPGHWKIGTIGQQISGTSMEIRKINEDGIVSKTICDNGKDGEIVYTGRHLFMGYMGMPKKTQSTIDEGGYLHSGDIGCKDADGFLKITGRLKELLITEGGENIPPVLIEQCIKKHCPALANVVCIGDQKKYLTCLVSLTTSVEDNGLPKNELFGPTLETLKELGIDAKTVEEAMASQKFQEHIEECIKKANAEATSNAQTIKYFRILPRDVSTAGGELTPTLKLKRRIVTKNYAKLIDSMYQGKNSVKYQLAPL